MKPNKGISWNSAILIAVIIIILYLLLKQWQ